MRAAGVAASVGIDPAPLLVDGDPAVWLAWAAVAGVAVEQHEQAQRNLAIRVAQAISGGEVK